MFVDLRSVSGTVVGAFAAAVVALAASGCVTTGDSLGQSLSGVASNLGMSGGGSAAGMGAGAGPESPDKELTPAEQRLRERSSAFQRTVVEGALIGAGAGALWGWIKGDQGDEVLKKALIGGAVGALAGTYIANKQKQYASKEEVLDSMIADVRRDNAETEAQIADLKEVIAADRRRIADLEQRVKAGRASEAELKRARERVAENRAAASRSAKGLRQRYASYRDAERIYREQHPGAGTGGLTRELDALQRNIEGLDRVAETYRVAAVGDALDADSTA